MSEYEEFWHDLQYVIDMLIIESNNNNIHNIITNNNQNNKTKKNFKMARLILTITF